MNKLKFDNNDKILIQKYLDSGGKFLKLTKKEQDRWQLMMALNDDFSNEYARELDLRNGADKAINEKDVIKLREQIDVITGRKKSFWDKIKDFFK